MFQRRKCSAPARKKESEPHTNHNNNRMIVERLPARILLSADLPGLDLVALDTTSPSDSELEQRLRAALLNHETKPDIEDQILNDTSDLDADVVVSRVLIVVDPQVNNYQQLIDDITNTATADTQLTVLVLEPGEDGLDQISNQLSTLDNLDAVHLFSHSNSSSITLGNGQLTLANLADNAAQLELWKSSLSEEADILIYGCDLAGSSEGQALIEEISRLTGADVAASDDTTGTAAAGGDWHLEYKTGEIDSAAPISLAMQDSYASVLGTFTVQNTNDSGSESLREAITNANAAVGADTIVFNIAGGGPHVIALSSALPSITDEVFIDGTSEPDFIGNGSKPIVVIDGNDLNADAINITATGDNTEIRGLVIRDFVDNAISIDAGADNVVVAGNFLGSLDTDGLDNGGGEAIGAAIVYVEGGNAVIGGITSADRNVIAGGANGVVVSGVQASGTQISGNFIGVDATGNTVITIDFDGVRVEAGAANVTVGGATAAHGNLVAGMGDDGIQISDGTTDMAVIQNNAIGVSASGLINLGVGKYGIYLQNSPDDAAITNNLIAGAAITGIEVGGSSDGTVIQGNVIGTDATQTYNWGSGENGILLENGAINTVIGGTTGGQGNVVAFSGTSFSANNAGIAIQDTSIGNTVQGNSIYGSRGAGIDLSLAVDDGVDTNDSGDGDTGGNNKQNSAVLSTAEISGTGDFTYDIDTSTLNGGTYTIDFYASDDLDGGEVEGKRYLASTTVAGGSSASATLSSVALAPGEYVTLTATDTVGNTSEFSNYAVAASSTAGGASPDDLTLTITNDGGLSINQDGGDDVYLQADDGGAVIGGLTSFTIETQLTLDSSPTFPHVLDYAVPGEDSELSLLLSSDAVRVSLGGTSVGFAGSYSQLRDGESHTLSVSWDGTTGDLKLYIDGVLQEILTGFQTGYTVVSGGILTVGNDQDSLGADFQTSQSVHGTLFDIRVFDQVRTDNEILANYDTTLPYDETGLLANWHFDSLSTNGVVTDSVSANNLTLLHIAEPGFTASSAALVLNVNENAVNGTVVGSVAGSDPERDALIATLLANNTGLYYNAETQKFYQYVDTGMTWTAARDNALTTILNGVSGQLVTIDSATENQQVVDILIANGGPQAHILASDAAIEGEWRQGDQATDTLFWLGAGSGFSVNGRYENWDASNPNNFAGGQHYAKIFAASGAWDDVDGSGLQKSIVEFDADAVLDNAGPIGQQPLVYSIIGQSIGGAFTIDSSSGTISVADGASLDFESLPVHVVTFRVTDIDGNTYDEAVSIAVNDLGGEPTHVLPGPQVIPDINQTLTFSAANGNAVSVSDTDAATDNRLQVFISVNDGVLTLSQTTGISILGGSNGSFFMTLQGSESDINAALEGMVFTPDADFSGSVTLQMNTSLGADMIGHYTFDGGNAVDQSVGLSQNGTLMGDATTVIDGTRGEVLTLDGAGDTVQIAGDFGQPPSVTFSAWVNADSGHSDVISINERVALSVNDPFTNSGVTALYHDGSSYQYVESNQILAGAGWHHLALTFDDSTKTMTLYIDGAVAASDTFTNSISYTGGNTFIGSTNGASLFLDGLVDDARIYTRALSEDEVLALASDATLVSGSVPITVNRVNDAPVLIRVDEIDFEGYTLGDLDTQNGWVSEKFNTTSDIQVTAGAGVDGNTALTFGITGAGVGVSASLVADSVLPNLADADSFTTEWSMQNSWWGAEFAFGFDANSDGQILRSSGEQALRVELRDSADQLRVTIPDGSTIDFAPGIASDNWVDLRWEIDLTANAGQGSGTLYYRDVTGGQTTWQTDASLTGINLGLNPVASDKTNAANWDAIYLHMEGDGNGFDNYRVEVEAESGRVPYAEGGAAIILDPDMNVVDMELSAADNFDGATLSLARNGGADVNDQYSATGTLVTLNPGTNNLVVGATTIGSVTQNSGGTLVLTFNTNATNALVNEAMQQIAYSNNGDAPPATAQIDWTFDDGGDSVISQGTPGALTAIGNTTVDIAGVNDDPVVTFGGANVTYVEDAAAIFIDASATVTDADLADFNGGVLSISVTANGSGDDRIRINNEGMAAGEVGMTTGPNEVYYGGVQIGTWSGSGAPLAITFNASADATAVEAVAQNITFENLSDDPSTLTRTVQFLLTDGDGGTSAAISKDIDVTLVNDAPVITSDGGTATAAVNAAENQTAVTTVVATDVDTGDVPTFTITGGADAAVFAVDLNSGALTFNTAPDFETFTDVNTDGVYEVEITADDGNTGADTQLISVTVSNVNEASTLVSISNNAVIENTDTSSGFSVGTLSSTDVDAGDSFTYSIVGGTDAAVFSIGGVGSDELILTDGVLDFESQPSYAVTIRTTDSGGLTFDQALIITVSDVNETPSFTSTAILASTEDVAYSYSIATTDPDSGDTLTITAPTLPAWLTLTDNGNGTATLTGTPTNAEVGPHSVSLQVSDGSLQDTQNFTVTVTNVNDAPVVDLDADDSSAAGVDFATTWTEGSGPVLIADNDATLGDVDTPNLTSLTVTLTNFLDDGNEFLAADTTGTSVIASYDAVSGVLTLSGSDTVANYQQVLRTATYDNTFDHPNETARTISFEANDGTDTSNIAITTLVVVGTEEAGVTITAIGTQGVGEQVTVSEQPVYSIATYQSQSVEVGSDGGAVVVWVSDAGQDGDGNSIMARLIDAQGNPIGNEFVVNSTGTGSQTDTSVAIDASGNFAVVWTSWNQDGNSGGIYAQRFDSSGVPLGGEFLVNTTTAGSQAYSSIAMADSGEFVIAWNGNGVGDTAGVFAQRFDANGVAQGGEFRINETTVDTQDHVEIASDGNGNFVATWTSQNQDGSGRGVYMHRFDSDGNSLGGEQLVNTFTAGDQWISSVAMNDSGEFVVGWRDEGQAGELYMQLFHADGAANGGEIQIPSSPTPTANYPQLAMDDAGNITAVWEDQSDSSDYAIVARQFDSSGTPIGAQFLINTHEEWYQEYPAISMNADGQFVVVFTDYDANGDGEESVEMRRFGGATTEAGGTTNFSFVLDTQPTDDVTIILTMPDATEGTLSTTTLTFTNADWNVAQVVTVTGVEDTLADGNMTHLLVTSTASSTDVAYNGLEVPDVNVINLDNDPALDLDTDNSAAVGIDYAATWTENGGSVGVVDTDANLTDPDGDTLSSVTVTLTNVLDGIDEVLEVDTTGTSIVANYNSGTGVLLLSGSHSVEDYQQVLSTVTYDNASEDPDVTSRVITFVANDGVNVSPVASTTLSMTAVNDAPSLISLNLTIDEGASVIVNTGNINSIDSDNSATELIYSATAVINGQFEYVASPNVAITSFSQADVDSGLVQFVHNGSETAPDYQLTVSDGVLSSGPYTPVMNFTNVNDAPLITSDGGAPTASVDANENQTAVTTVAATDVDSGDVPTYSISGGADAALFGVDLNSGELTFNTARDFESFADVNTDGVYEVEITADDGNAGTDVQLISVTVTDVNEVPTLLSISNSAVIENTDTSSGFSAGTLSSTDVDAGESFTYSIVGGVDAGVFSIGGVGTDELILTDGVLDFETQPSYAVTVRTTDSGGLIHDQALVITVTDVNEAPSFTSPNTFLSAESQTAAGTVTSSDVDGGAPQYTIVGAVDDSLFGIDINTGVLTFNTAPDFEAPTDTGSDNVYDITVQVDDQNGGTATQNIAITVVNVNQLTAVDDTIATNQDTPLVFDPTTNDTDDDGGTIDTVEFTQPANGTVTDNGDGTLTYTPNGGFSGSDSFDYVAINADANLQHHWVLNGDAVDVVGGAHGTLTGTDTIAGNFGNALNFDEVGDYVTVPDITYGSEFTLSFDFKVDEINGSTFQYLYSHGDVNSTDSINVFINEDTHGTDPSVLRTVVRDSNDSLDNAALQVDISGIVGDTQWHTYTLTSGPSGLEVFIDGVSANADPTRGTDGVNPAGNLYLGARQDLDMDRLYGGALDSVQIFSTALDALEVQNFYANQHHGTVTITVNDVPDFSSSTSFGISENSTAVGTITSVDVDGGAPLYTLVGAIDDGLFSLDTNTGILAFNTAPDFEVPADVGVDNVYNITVQVDDQNGATATQNIAITVGDVNETPTLVAISNSVVAENTDTSSGFSVGTLSSTDVDTGDTFTYSIVGGADAGVFSIGGVGSDELILTDGVLDFESQPSYTVTVRTTDSGGLTYDQVLVISVNDANEIPLFSSTATLASTEDVAYSYSITTTDPDTGDTLTITAPTLPTWLTLTDNGNGTATLSGTPTNAEVGPHAVSLQVSDGSLQDTQNFTITVTNANDAPVINSDGGAATAALNVDENQAAVTTVVATDVDAGDVPTYTISGGSDATLFAVDLNTGVLTFNTAPNFETFTDTNTDGVYEVEITADDGNTGTDTQLISVTVTDVNEVPTLVSIGNNPVIENTDTSSGFSVGTLSSTDVDTGDTFTYSIVGGADAGVFSIGGVGSDELILTDGVLDFEAQPSYAVIIRTTDSGGLTHDQAVVITVTDVNETPTFSSTAILTSTEDVVYSYNITTTDPDTGDALTITAPTVPTWLTLTDNGNGTATLSGTPTNAEVGPHSVSLQVSDGSLQSVQNFTVTVTNANDAPLITSDGGAATASINAEENQAAVTTVVATDVDAGDVATYSISGGADAALFAVDLNTGVLTFNTAPDFETFTDTNTDGVYEVEITADDGNTGTDTQLISVTVTDVNEVPTLVSISNNAVIENTDTSSGFSVGTLTSADVDTGDTFAYSIVGGADAGVFSIGGVGADELILADGVLDFESQPSYAVTIRTTDSGGLTLDQALIITVTDQNEAPIFSSTATLASTEDVAYSYSITTTDPDTGDVITITAPTLPSWLTLTDNGNGTATLSGTPSNAEVGPHTVSLQVSDGNFQGTQNFTITVTNTNDAPVITNDGGAATASVNAIENQVNVTTVSAIDADIGDVPTYTISGGSDAALFAVDLNTGVLTFNTAPDFETFADGNTDGVYEVEIAADDGNTGTDTQLISVTVTDVNEVPTLVSISNNAVIENTDTSSGFSVGTLSSTDVDAGDSFTYSIVGGADAGVFSIGGVGSDELILTDGVLDFESQPSYTVTVRTTDSGGLTYDQVLVISVNDANEIPLFSSTATLASTEDVAYSYSITTTDPDTGDTLTITAPTLPTWLTLTDNGNGTATLSGTPTNAEVGPHAVSLQVSDGSLQDTQDFTVTVTNANDAPVINSDGGAATSALNANENQTTVTTVVATDVDAGDVPTYTISGGSDAALFAVDLNTGVLTFNTTPDFETFTDANTDGVYEVEITADDGNTGTDTQLISVTVTNVNEVPTLVAISNTAVIENTDTSGGFSVGTLTSADVDAGDTFTYSIVGGANAGVFSIGGVGADELILTDGVLDFESQPSYAVTIRTTDSGGLTVDQALIITVSDVNEAPVFSSSAILAGSEDVAYSYSITTTDPDTGDTLTITAPTLPSWLTLTDNGNGTATLAGTPTNAEVGPHTVSLQISDGSLQDTQDFTITVTNANDAPVITSDGGAATAALNANENQITVTTVVATDMDAGDVPTYTISGGADAALFGVDLNTGVLTFNTAPDFETFTDGNTDGVYEVEITANDGSTGTDTQLISVTVTDVNEVPTLVSISNNAVIENTDTSSGFSVGTLTSADVDAGDSFTYSIVGGADAAVFSIGGVGSDELILTDGVLDFESQPSYAVTIRTTDSGGLTHDQAMIITVTDQNEAPIFSSTAILASTEDVAYSYSITSTDPDTGGTLTITSPTLPTWLVLTDNGNGTATLAGTPTNAEVGPHTVSLQVSDGSLVDTQNFTITVANANDSPVITSDGGAATASVNSAENQVNVTTVSAIDTDIGDVVTYAITGGADAALFGVDINSGVLTFNTPQDFETFTDANTDGVYEVEITADDGNTGTDTQLISVTVTNVNEVPTSVAISNTAVMENTDTSGGFSVGTLISSDVDAGDSFTYSIVGGRDAAIFSIGGVGSDELILTDDVLDFETQPSYAVTIRTTDSGGLSVDQALVVTVNDVNEAPAFTSAAINTSTEDVPYSYNITTAESDAGDILTITDLTLPAWLTLIDNGDGTATLTGTPSNIEVGTHNVSLQVSDGSLQDTQNFTITVLNINDAPVITSDGGGATVALTVPENEMAVTTVAAVDADTNDVIVYSITGGDDAGQFQINTATGSLSFITAQRFNNPSDIDGNGVYEVEVSASDVDGLFDSQQLSVAVTAVPELGTVLPIEPIPVEPFVAQPVVPTLTSSPEIEQANTEETEAETDPDLLVQLTGEPESTGSSFPINSMPFEFPIDTITEIEAPVDPTPVKHEAGSDSGSDSENRLSKLLRIWISAFSESVTSFQDELDRQRFMDEISRRMEDYDEQAESEARTKQFVAQVATGLSLTLTAGFVSWILRAGAMIASLLTSMPAWRQLDLLPILSASDDKDLKDTPDDADAPDEQKQDEKSDERVDSLLRNSG